MKILLISNYPPDQQQSMLRYAEMLKQELSTRGWTVSVVHPPVIFGRLTFLRGSVKKWIGYIDKYLLAPIHLRKYVQKVDLVHICDHSNAMYLRTAGKKPVLVTCHDLLAIKAAQGMYTETTTGFTGRILQQWILRNLLSAKYIVCVSEKTRQDIQDLAPHTRAIIKVIHHSLNWPYSPANKDAIAEAKRSIGLTIGIPYFLHVGGNQWYKNRLGVMALFAALRQNSQFRDARLVLAGKPWTDEMRRYCDSHALNDTIIERTNLFNEELQAFYSGATALLFPSLEEGFGWPVLEAQACGCPVVTSNRPPMTEIAGDAALFIDPLRVEESAQHIADQSIHFASMQEAGFRNLERFTVEKMIDRYAGFYQQIAEEMSSTHPPRSM